MRRAPAIRFLAQGCLGVDLLLFALGDDQEYEAEQVVPEQCVFELEAE